MLHTCVGIKGSLSGAAREADTLNCLNLHVRYIAVRHLQSECTHLGLLSPSQRSKVPKSVSASITILLVTI